MISRQKEPQYCSATEDEEDLGLGNWEKIPLGETVNKCDFCAMLQRSIIILF